MTAPVTDVTEKAGIEMVDVILAVGDTKGGDGGYILITPNGVKRIPPWEPPIQSRARAIGALLRASQELGSRAGKPVTEIATKLADELVAKNGGSVVAFFDGDGGFCGTPWGPPIPLPRPGVGGRTVIG